MCSALSPSQSVSSTDSNTFILALLGKAEKVTWDKKAFASLVTGIHTETHTHTLREDFGGGNCPEGILYQHTNPAAPDSQEEELFLL